MSGKITIQELTRRFEAGEFGELEMRRYFRPNDSRSPKPFYPGLELDPDTVEIPTGGDIGVFREDFPLPVKWVINDQRAARDMEYHRHVRQGYSPIIITRGDSWFLHPALWDTIDWLRGAYAMHSFDYPGDTLDDIINDKAQWEAAIRNEGAGIFMLSGGGNDLLGGGNLGGLLHHFDPAITDPAKYLLPAYHTLVSTALGKIKSIIQEVLALSKTVQIICHGYDYAIPNDGPWMGRPMAGIGITDRALQRRIIAHMVDAYNAQLHALIKPYSPRVYHLDLRGVVTTGWKDELHPTEAGFRQIAAHFRAVIDKPTS